MLFDGSLEIKTPSFPRKSVTSFCSVETLKAKLSYKKQKHKHTFGVFPDEFKTNMFTHFQL